MTKIRILYITSILCHHEFGFWDCISMDNEYSFYYMSTRKPGEEISYRYLNNDFRGYHINSHSYSNEQLKTIIDNADIIFIGAVEDLRIWKHIEGKSNVTPILEHYSRFRPLLPNIPIEALRRIKFYLSIKKRLEGYHKKYILCNSYYTDRDFRWCFKDQVYLRFSYFENYLFPSIESLNNKDKNNILYVGRGDVDFKCVGIAYKAFRYFKKIDRYQLNVVGKNVKRSNLKDIRYIEYFSHIDMMKAFEQSSIFLFTSDRREGWGVVLNEAMSKGCIVFASSKAGSTNVLIEDGVNGFTFSSFRELKKKINIFLSMGEDRIIAMRMNAINNIRDKWNGTIAYKRAKKFIECMLSNKMFEPYSDGPLSLAK